MIKVCSKIFEGDEQLGFTRMRFAEAMLDIEQDLEPFKVGHNVTKYVPWSLYGKQKWGTWVCSSRQVTCLLFWRWHACFEDGMTFLIFLSRASRSKRKIKRLCTGYNYLRRGPKKNARTVNAKLILRQKKFCSRTCKVFTASRKTGNIEGRSDVIRRNIGNNINILLSVGCFTL